MARKGELAVCASKAQRPLCKLSSRKYMLWAISMTFASVLVLSITIGSFQTLNRHRGQMSTSRAAVAQVGFDFPEELQALHQHSDMQSAIAESAQKRRPSMRKAAAATSALAKSAPAATSAETAEGSRHDGDAMNAPSKRMLVKRGRMSLRSPRTKAAVERLLSAVNVAVEKEDGYVESLNRKATRTSYSTAEDHFEKDMDLEEKRDRNGEYLVISFVVRVPADRFLVLFEACKQLPQALLLDESYEVEDVTAKFIDVAARAASLQATHDQLVELMKRAEEIKDVLEVQNYLTGVQQDLESKKQQQNWLEKEASLSTISIRLEESPPGAKTDPTSSETWRVVKTFHNALEMWAGIVADFVDVSIYLVMFGVPALGTPWLAYRLFSKFIDDSVSGISQQVSTSSQHVSES